MTREVESVRDRIQRAREILQILKSNFSIPTLSNIVDDPFKVLIRTVISQSTAEANTRRAYENLSRRMLVTPRRLAEADVKEIEDALRVAGLYRNKSKIMKKLSRRILEEYGGSLDFIYSTPLEEARGRLMELPGVGPKTADIILLFSAKKPTLPVDTHVNRVSKRLGLASRNSSYEAVRRSLQELYPPEEYFQVHMLLIALGRRYCKALNPLCQICPVKEKCPSAK
ncbi:MAG: endonuclease III domain-containing protein [Candidatus Bathyarchaeia archaeon]